MSWSHAQGELLGQLRPANTTAATIFTADELRVEITLILACPRSGTTGATDIDIYHDDDGSTYDDDSIIFAGQVSDNGNSLVFQAQHPGSGIMVKPGGTLGVKTSVASEINFLVYGITESIADRVRPL